MLKYLLIALACLGIVSGAWAQQNVVTISGSVKDKQTKEKLPYVNVILKTSKDSVFVTGAASNDEGLFSLTGVRPGEYYLEISYVGYELTRSALFVGSASAFLDAGVIEMESASKTLSEVVITGTQETVSDKLDKKTYSLEQNVSQTGGSVLQAMQNLPGVTVQDGKVQLRGSEKITILIDGKQTALTGFGSQTGLDNIPASAIERIEIINNPSSKYDANGNAGMINIVMKKSRQEVFSGKVGLTAGVGSLWVRRENLPTIRPQFTVTPKISPSLFLSYRRNKLNAFIQADHLFTQTLNKNEFVTRTYDDGTVIRQQTKRNRNTNFLTIKAGFDWYLDDYNTLTVSGLYGSERIIDRGDEPFFNAALSERTRLWRFLEDELKTTAMATAGYQHRFKKAGHLLNAGFNYTFHREDEKYFFDNILPAYTGKDAFKLLSDEKVIDLSLDYIRPLKYGRIETGVKFRKRDIPTNMQFIPGLNSPLDTNAGGWATYREIIPAVYGNYIFETKKLEAEIGLRVEYVKLDYEVNPGHNTYKSNGYHYTQPFPNMRVAWKLNDHNKLSLFYNRRVDRPNEVDIRIFPKYDDAEIIKVGNPALRPQFTQSFELGYKTSTTNGYVYAAAYHRISDGTITRISSTVAGSNLIYAIFQNAGGSYNTGLEMVFNRDFLKWYSMNLNMNGYYNQIDAFTVQNLYPAPHTFSADQQTAFSGNVKLINNLHLSKQTELQFTVVWLAPDIVPQGRTDSRFSVDAGIKKALQKGKGQLFLNANDLFNTLVIRSTIQGDGFRYTSVNYYETQVIRVGYSYKF